MEAHSLAKWFMGIPVGKAIHWFATDVAKELEKILISELIHLNFNITNDYGEFVKSQRQGILALPF